MNVIILEQILCQVKERQISTEKAIDLINVLYETNVVISSNNGSKRVVVTKDTNTNIDLIN